ncbi:hypothetical protein [Thermococcus barossii]|uniref:hypothetical protein n=1 Tax=Thermococcus barossii TaxID=54077 RepID=UPI0012FE7C9A|nr:hypothetical protein [Thermococcus barossii]
MTPMNKYRHNTYRRYKIFIQIAKRYWYDIVKYSEKSWKHTFDIIEGITLKHNEPSYVGAYLYYGLSQLNRDLLIKSLFGKELDMNGFQLKFGGIFVHQNPIVEVEPSNPSVKGLSRRTCEIGDLLIIFTFVDKNNVPLINRAFLSQAKIDDTPVRGAQRILYEKDVRFRFKRPLEENIQKNSCAVTRHNRYPRRFPSRWPKSRGLKYLRLYPLEKETRLELLDRDKFCPCLEYCYCRRPWCCNEYPFGCSIFGLMTGQDGWKFSLNPNPPLYICGWNHIMHDLITDTAHRVSTLGGLKKGKDRFNRGQYLSYLVSQFNRFENINEHFIGMNPLDPEPPGKTESPEGPNGINTMLIMVKDTKTESEHTQE